MSGIMAVRGFLVCWMLTEEQPGASFPMMITIVRHIRTGKFTMFIESIITIILSMVALVCFLAMAESRPGIARVCKISAGAAVLSLLFLSEALVLHMTLTGLVSLACFASHATPRVARSVLTTATLGSYACVIVPPIANRYLATQLRAEFPLESLSARLAYERKPDGSSKMSANASSPLSEPIESNLRHLEGRDYEAFYRGQMLERIHSDHQANFLEAMSFGYRRMVKIRVRKEAIVLPESPPIPFEVSTKDGSTVSLANRTEPSSATPHPGEVSLTNLNWASLEDFLDKGRMGYVQDREHVAGFLPHRFTKMPGPTTEPWRNTWQISRLELIGILKHATPRVYISERLPRMDDLAKAPTRDTNWFEADALRRLRTKEDLVIDYELERIWMVGSLRAGSDCQKCHAVQRGELLGALSYELVTEKHRNDKTSGFAAER